MSIRTSWRWLLGLVCALQLASASAWAADVCTFKTAAGRALLAPSPEALPGATTYVYKSAGGHPLRLYVFQPQLPGAHGPRSAVVMFHGGGWMFGNVDGLVQPAKYFAARGDVVVLVDYRVFCRDKVNIIDEIKDAKAAMRWVRGHARDLKIAPNRIAVFGGSSGGHLALATALFDNLDDPVPGPRPNGHPDLLVLFFPCVDETSPEEAISAPAIQTYAKAVSPTLHVARGLPPMLVVQGTADPLYHENKTYCAKVNAAGDSCSFVEFRGAPHGFTGVSPAWNDGGWDEMDGFLTAYGYLPPHPAGPISP